MFLASVAALPADTLSLCPTGVSTACAGTYSYQYAGDEGGAYAGDPAVLSAWNKFPGWVSGASGKWVSISDAAALAPAGIEVFDPKESGLESDPQDPGSTHTWTDSYLVSYILSFTAPSFIPGTARLAGSWAADDGGLGATGVFLNGVRVDQIPVWGTGSYSVLHSFDTAISNLLPGVNKLEFRVEHSDGWYDGVLVDSLALTGVTAPILPFIGEPGPGDSRIDIGEGDPDPAPVSEPSLLLLPIAGAAWLLFRRR